MGGCCSSPDDGRHSLTPRTKRDKERQIKTWQASGIISVRSAGHKELPEEVRTALRNARVLDAAGNNLQSIPDWVLEASSLKRLLLQSNALRHLPSGLSQLRSLRVLNLANNALTHLPDLQGLVLLQVLTLSQNHLEEVDPSIGCLTALTQLDVSGNKLTRLPPTLGKCMALTEVLASDNRLVEVPIELGRLQKLQTLNLERNSLAVIPPAVLVGCTCLQTLLLQGNALTSEQLAATEGYADYEQRRQRKYDKVLATNVLTSGFTEAIDRDVAVT
ncbi:hypothetical protein ACKKBG_A24475 [Auxenochlorella protothecoides x Auxenochlorella symbiontica]